MEHLISSAIVAVAFQLGPSTFAASSSREVWQVTVLANGVKLYYPVEKPFLSVRSRPRQVAAATAEFSGNRRGCGEIRSVRECARKPISGVSGEAAIGFGKHRKSSPYW